MGYQICYLIDVPGFEFNGLLRPQDRVDGNYLDWVRQTHSLSSVRASLLGDDMHITVDLGGEWTSCELPYSYSLRLHDDPSPYVRERLRQVDRWERALRTLVPSARIFRIDEFLYAPWYEGHDCLLLRSSQDVERFLEWLKTEDPQNFNWSELPRTVPEAGPGDG